MKNRRAISVAQELLQRYDTRNPENLAAELEIEIVKLSTLKRQKGFFKVIANVCFIFVNSNLSREMQKMVVAHELGHALLHKEYCVKSGGIIEFEIFDMTNEMEYEANVFQATLLIDDYDLIDQMQQGYDVVAISRNMGININLLLLKLNIMMQENQSYRFNLPYVPYKDFLGKIGDNAGTL